MRQLVLHLNSLSICFISQPLFSNLKNSEASWIFWKKKWPKSVLKIEFWQSNNILSQSFPENLKLPRRSPVHGLSEFVQMYSGEFGDKYFFMDSIIPETPFFTTLFSNDFSAKCKQKSKHLRIRSEKRKQKRFPTKLLLKCLKKNQRQFYQVFCGVQLFCESKYLEKFNLFGFRKK